MTRSSLLVSIISTHWQKKMMMQYTREDHNHRESYGMRVSTVSKELVSRVENILGLVSIGLLGLEQTREFFSRAHNCCIAKSQL